MVQKVEHAVLKVQDIDRALEFYQEVLGFVEIETGDGISYLSCGLDERFDLGLVEGGSGLHHFAIRVENKTLEAFRESFAQKGIEFHEPEREPGIEDGVQFEIPSGITMEVVTVQNDPRYNHISDTAHRHRSSKAPVSIDHVNLMSEDVEQDVHFLNEHVDFKITEVQQNEDSGNWDLVFTRFGDQHHDVGISTTDDPKYNLHHIAWTMVDIKHLTTLVDELARNGHELEVGISRHLAGNNIFSYLWTPGGNRVELSTEMTTLHEDTDTMYRDRSFTFTSWGGIHPPESFFGGS